MATLELTAEDAEAGPPPQENLEVVIEEQEKSEWCWAAVAVGLGRKLQTRVATQCQLATEVTGEQCCPVDRHSPVGNSPQFLESVLPRMNIRATVRGRLSMSELTRRIGLDRIPIPVQIRWRGSDAAHYVCVDGYINDTTVWPVPVVLVRDPMDGGTHPVELGTLEEGYVNVLTGVRGRWFGSFLLDVQGG